jgi:RNA polymerase sigma-B factor
VNSWSADIMEALFLRYSGSRDEVTRNEIMERYAPLAAKAAYRYLRPGLEYEDLYQVAMMSLLRAIERFDSGKGVKFAAFALPTLLGDLKHYIRDYSTAMRPPRSAGELVAKLRRAEAELASVLGRYPTTEETAKHVGVSLERALEALETANSLHFMMIDGAENQDGEAMETVLGAEDGGFEDVVNRETVRAVLSGLNDTDRRLVMCRYIHGMTQAEIAREMGITQMTVSRMERRILETLKKRHGG